MARDTSVRLPDSYQRRNHSHTKNARGDDGFSASGAEKPSAEDYFRRLRWYISEVAVREALAAAKACCATLIA
jgi:hypothetical protein